MAKSISALLFETLQGKWFHLLDSEGRIDKQGQIIFAEAASSHLKLQLYSFASGEPTDVVPYKLTWATMHEFVLYDTDTEMREAFDAELEPA